MDGMKDLRPDLRRRNQKDEDCRLTTPAAGHDDDPWYQCPDRRDDEERPRVTLEPRGVRYVLGNTNPAARRCGPPVSRLSPRRTPPSGSGRRQTKGD